MAGRRRGHLSNFAVGDAGERATTEAPENRGAGEPAFRIYVGHKFMRLRGPFFRSRTPFASLSPAPF